MGKWFLDYLIQVCYPTLYSADYARIRTTGCVWWCVLHCHCMIDSEWHNGNMKSTSNLWDAELPMYSQIHYMHWWMPRCDMSSHGIFGWYASIFIPCLGYEWIVQQCAFVLPRINKHIQIKLSVCIRGEMKNKHKLTIWIILQVHGCSSSVRGISHVIF